MKKLMAVRKNRSVGPGCTLVPYPGLFEKKKIKKNDSVMTHARAESSTILNSRPPKTGWKGQGAL